MNFLRLNSCYVPVIKNRGEEKMYNFQNDLQSLGMDNFQVGDLMPIDDNSQDMRQYGGRCGGYRCGGYRCGGYRCGGYRCGGYRCYNCYSCYSCYSCYNCWGGW
ncbi:heterocycloanthracin/sonorensin family bacteriocin [Peribacillus saganii]|uniref:Heterocycloanthracin/sonorensin family bacteriocin n=1 Tax=Peribacillus saganii TaxID=2303992 RepID=A0A372LMK4_9BACI|nr:heterocycloanthracin/sonorensin family bacteriocin [Peribacillus saganii]